MMILAKRSTAVLLILSSLSLYAAPSLAASVRDELSAEAQRDWDAARESVRRLAALNPGMIAPSHGRPISGPHATQSLHELAEAFDAVARPEHGKYVERGSTPAAEQARL